MSLMLYVVLAASGGWVNGAEVAIGAEVPLSDAEARYELDLGTVAPTGRVPTQPPPPPVLLPTDLVETVRDRIGRPVPVASLDAYLLRAGGAILAYLAQYEAGLSEQLGAPGGPLDDLRAALLGGAGSDADTLGKLAVRLATRAASGINRDITDLLGVDGAGVRLRASSTTLASAATVDLGAAPTLKVRLTGAARVVSFGAVPHGIVLLHFASALSLAHDPARLVLPGAADILAAAGDTAIATSDAAGIWTVRAYQRASGLPLGVRRGQLLRAVSQGLPGGLAAFLDAGLILADPDSPTNLAFYHEPFALPGGTLAGLLATYCRTVLGMSAAAADTQVASLFATAATLTPGT